MNALYRSIHQPKNLNSIILSKKIKSQRICLKICKEFLQNNKKETTDPSENLQDI